MAATIRSLIAALLPLAIAMTPAPPACAQSSTEAELRKYRDMMKADPWANPAMLDADKGEQLWRTPRGPANASLEACDLGKGKGVVAGAYAQMPRYFADAGRVMDLETRLVWCMTTLQGFDRAALLAKPFAAAGQPTSDIAALATYVASKSSGQALAPHSSHPQEREAIALGEALYWRRQGPRDFACASCHASDGKRIRLQDLANLAKPEGAREAMAEWPAYRVSTGYTMTMQHRLFDCFWQMRLPPLQFGSPVAVALSAYLASRAQGAQIAAPSIKR